MAKVEQQAMRAAGRYLAHLIDCALHGADAEGLPEGATWPLVHALAVRNSVEGASWLGARTRPDVPDDLRERWSSEADMTLFRRVRFDAEREQILAAMEYRGLSYLPLKGVLLAGYYPHPAMRSMADNDILYGFVEEDPAGGFRVRGGSPREQERSTSEAMQVMKSIMMVRGYEVESLGINHHDGFHKEPCFNFEMHRRLVGSAIPHASYYANSWKRAVRDDAGAHAFRFSDEDEYLFFLVHAFKHFDMTGCGIRFVVDQRVFLDAKGRDLDWEYVRGELRALDLAEFEERTRSLADAAFRGACSMGRPDGAPLLDDDQEELLHYLLGSGTYGSMNMFVERKLDKIVAEEESLPAAKRRYVHDRVFISDDTMKDAFPLFYRHKALRPLLPAFRACRAAVRNPRRILQELQTLLRARR